MKLFVKMAFIILFFVLLYLASVSSLFFSISLIVCPIFAIILIIVKFKSLNKIKYNKTNITSKTDKPKNTKNENQKDSTD